MKKYHHFIFVNNLMLKAGGIFIGLLFGSAAQIVFGLNSFKTRACKPTFRFLPLYEEALLRSQAYWGTNSACFWLSVLDCL
jgi:hypothetical protein